MRLAAFIALFMLITTSARAANDPAEGLWLTENKRAVIELRSCPQGLCGYVYWIIPGGMQYDAKNPDKTKRGEPMCGLPILWGFAQDSAGKWSGGTIYKADEGDLYDANLEVQSDGTLKLRGYMGISLLGKTQTWTPVSAEDYEVCKLPQ